MNKITFKNALKDQWAQLRESIVPEKRVELLNIYAKALITHLIKWI